MLPFFNIHRDLIFHQRSDIPLFFFEAPPTNLRPRTACAYPYEECIIFITYRNICEYLLNVSYYNIVSWIDNRFIRMEKWKYLIIKLHMNWIIIKCQNFSKSWTFLANPSGPLIWIFICQVFYKRPKWNIHDIVVSLHFVFAPSCRFFVGNYNKDDSEENNKKREKKKK